MIQRPIVALAVLAALPACVNETSPHASGSAPGLTVPIQSAASGSATGAESTGAPPSTEGSAAAKSTTPSCGADEFVACASGADCTRRGGVLIAAKPCHARAADACAALSCAHGCNIHHGIPKMVLCAPNASSSSNMKRCGGLANWACPEGMECDLGTRTREFDAMGTCVAIAP
jgi:hypothetical protein